MLLVLLVIRIVNIAMEDPLLNVQNAILLNFLEEIQVDKLEETFALVHRVTMIATIIIQL